MKTHNGEIVQAGWRIKPSLEFLLKRPAGFRRVRPTQEALLTLMTKQSLVQRLILMAMIGGAAALLAGCGSCKPGKPGPIGKYDIRVNLDESLKQSSVLVDLVGVNAGSLPRWETYSMRSYWEDNDPMRRDADKETFTFVSGQTLSKTFEAKNPRWEQWKKKGVTHVLVLADLPGGHTDKPGNQDARRQILSLDECVWPKKTSELTLLVKRSGIDILTPMRAR